MKIQDNPRDLYASLLVTSTKMSPSYFSTSSMESAQDKPHKHIYDTKMTLVNSVVAQSYRMRVVLACVWYDGGDIICYVQYIQMWRDDDEGELEWEKDEKNNSASAKIW